MVIIALPNVSVRLWYVSGATLPRSRNAVSVCKCPNSTSTGVVIRETACFLESDGCRLAPVMEASKKSTATPLGGVSPMVRLIGTPPTEDALRFMEELQASSKTQQVMASAKDKWLRMVNPQAMDWTDTPIDGREVGALNLYLRAALTIRRARRAGSSGRRTLRRSAKPAKPWARANHESRNKECGVKDSGRLCSTRKMSSGRYSYSSPHSSHRT